MNVQDLVEKKSGHVYTVGSELTIEDAINQLCERKIGSLVVMDGESPVGILTASDVLRCHVRNREKTFQNVKIRDAMTNKLIVAEPDDEVSEAMAMMIKAEIKHLPVIKEGKIFAMLSIRDLVQHQVESLTAELHFLRDYVADLEEAGRD